MSKRSLFISICVTLVFVAICYSRPWYPITSLIFNETDESEYLVTIETSLGDQIKRIHVPNVDGKELEFSGVRVASIESSTLEEKKIGWRSEAVTLDLKLTKELVDLPKTQSKRNDIRVLVAIGLVSVFFMLAVYLLAETISQISLKGTGKFLLRFSPVLAAIATMLVMSWPGFFSSDILYNYRSSLRYEYSSFIGPLYASLYIVLAQLVPRYWIMLVLNAAVIGSVLMGLYHFSVTHKIKKLFYVVTTLFFLYPTTFLVNFSMGRDPISFWIFCAALFCFYRIKLEQPKGWTSYILFGVVLAAAMLLRQEAPYALIPGLLAASFIFIRPHFKRLAAVTLISLLFVLSVSGVYRLSPETNAHYQTTLLINPLSYIINAKYGDKLPPSIDVELGRFFKNDYLVTHYSPFDIEPFHRGGLNGNENYESYEKFRRAALEIIWDNKTIFLQNRLALAQKMMGFMRDYPSLNDAYFTEPNAEIIRLKKQIFFPMAERSTIGWMGYDAYVGYLYKFSPLWSQSYLIPLCLILGGILCFKWAPFYLGVASIIALRMLGVFITAPAGYYKYQYPTWIFAVFSLLFLWVEIRKRKQVQSAVEV